MATKKRTARRSPTRSRSKSAETASFKIVKDDVPFTSTRFTKQTFFWIILLAFIVVMQLWIIKLQTDVGNLTNTIMLLQQEK